MTKRYDDSLRSSGIFIDDLPLLLTHDGSESIGMWTGFYENGGSLKLKYILYGNQRT